MGLPQLTWMYSKFCAKEVKHGSKVYLSWNSIAGLQRDLEGVYMLIKNDLPLSLSFHRVVGCLAYIILSGIWFYLLNKLPNYVLATLLCRLYRRLLISSQHTQTSFEIYDDFHVHLRTSHLHKSETWKILPTIIVLHCIARIKQIYCLKIVITYCD